MPALGRSAMKAKINIILLVVLVLMVTGCNKNWFLYVYSYFFRDPGLAALALVAPAQNDEVSIDLCLNDLVYQPGDTIEFSLDADALPNGNGNEIFEIYNYVLLPNGFKMIFNTSSDMLKLKSGFIDDPSSFGHFEVDLSNPFHSLYSLKFPDNAPPGEYEFGALVTPLNAVDDGELNPGDLLGKVSTSFYLDNGPRPTTGGFNTNLIVAGYNLIRGNESLAFNAIAAEPQRREVVANLCKNMNTFTKGDTLEFILALSYIGEDPFINTDIYLGAILPDNLTFITVDENGLINIGDIDDPSSWVPYMVSYRLDRFNIEARGFIYNFDESDPEGDIELIILIKPSVIPPQPSVSTSYNEFNSGDLIGWASTGIFVVGTPG
jgi:hypothetical protein